MKRRTLSQNAALHLWCKQVADALNDAGYDMPVMLRLTNNKMDVSWDGHNVKEKLWKPYQLALTQCESTTEPSVVDYSEIYEELSKRISELTGVYVPWPSQETLEAEES